MWAVKIYKILQSLTPGCRLMQVVLYHGRNAMWLVLPLYITVSDIDVCLNKTCLVCSGHLSVTSVSSKWLTCPLIIVDCNYLSHHVSLNCYCMRLSMPVILIITQLKAIVIMFLEVPASFLQLRAVPNRCWWQQRSIYALYMHLKLSSVLWHCW